MTSPVSYRLNQAEDFMYFPTRVVYALIPNEDVLNEVIQTLGQHDIPASELKVLHGEAGRKILNADGSEDGVMGKFIRALENVSEVQRTYVTYVDEQMAKGHYALAVPVEKEEQREAVGDVLKAAHSHFIVYFGRASIVDIQVPRDVAVL